MAGPVPLPDQPVASTSSANVFSFKNSTLEEVLEDLSSRFILNLPEEELVSVERICFQVEQAHWYYEDFIREEEPRFPSMALKTFSRHLFHACPLLQHWSEDHDQAFQDFLDYKTSVPVCGVIMLNPSWTKCVLVKGWKSSSSWSFPRGKINADEPEHECAARETMEETGFDVADKIIMDAVIRLTFKEQKTTLYIVPNIPEDTVFATRTRKEISKIQWFPLADLPLWKKGVKESSHKFYGIAPVIGPLKAMMKTLRKADWERANALRAVQTNGGHQEESATTGHHEEPAVDQHQQWPSDPAIISAQTKPEGGDHLSRLLGGLDLFGASSTPIPATVAPAVAPVTSSSRVTNGGPLPTPQATPSAAAAVKTPLPVPPPTGSSHIAPIQLLSRNPAHASASTASNGHAAFASPTPPHSGDSTKSNANHLAASKSKFEFISPFDALASPPKKRAETNSSTPITAPSTSVSTSTNPGPGPPDAKSSATPTPTATTSSTSPTRPTLGGGRPRGMSAASEHFAPASLSRARYARSRGLSTSTVASVASLSASASVASVTSPLSVASDAASASENTSTNASAKIPGNGIGPTGRPEREASNDGAGSGNGTRQAKHAALLQSLAADLFKSSRSTPALPQSAPPPVAYPPTSVSGFSSGHGPVQFQQQQQRFGMQPSPSLPGTPGPLSAGAGSTFLLQSQPAGPRPLPLFANGKGNGNGALPLGPGPPSRMVDPFVVQHPRPVQHQPIQLNGSGIGNGLSHSRSITPTAFTAPPPAPSYPPRDRDGGGPGSPIPVIPPSQPLQRSQLLSLLNGTPAPAPAPIPRAQSTFAPQQQLHHPPPQAQMQIQPRPVSMHPYQQQQPASFPRPLAIPPNLAHFQGQGGPSPLTPGGRPLPQAPYPAPNASAHLGPVPAAAQLPAPGPPPPPPANLSLLSILNQPGPVTSYR